MAAGTAGLGYLSYADVRAAEMTVEPATVLPVLGLLGLQRVVELAWSRHNERRLISRGAEREPRDGLGAIVSVQVAFFVGISAEAVWGPWTALGGPWTVPALLVWLSANGLRYWCIFALGDRWTIRVLRLPGAPLVEKGPYRWMRHPNYLGVFLELLAFPIMFGAWATAVAIGILNALALRRRVRIEETFLRIRREA